MICTLEEPATQTASSHSLRIGIMGAHGTGKTTLARRLADYLGLPLIEEQARKAAEELRLRDIGDLTPDQALSFQQMILDLQMAAEKAHPSGFVSDRTVLDNLAYWYYHGLHYRAAVEFNRAFMRVLAYIGTNPYDLIVWVSPEWPIEDDGFRFTCPHCRWMIDGIIYMLLRSFPSLDERLLRVIGNTDLRFETVIKTLEDDLGRDFGECR